jgi:type IV secretory pathway TrbD component
MVHPLQGQLAETADRERLELDQARQIPTEPLEEEAAAETVVMELRKTAELAVQTRHLTLRMGVAAVVVVVVLILWLGMAVLTGLLVDFMAAAAAAAACLIPLERQGLVVLVSKASLLS